MNNIFLLFPYDYILIVLISLIIIFSIWRGFIQSILGLLTWIGSILITLYAYNVFALFITNQLLKIKFFQNYELVSNIIGIIISIPIVFLVSLFILKKIRKFLSSDLDRQILGIIIDKFFGLIYGIFFSYLILTTILFIFNKFGFISLNIWLIDNSNILLLIENFNNEYIYDLITPIKIIE